LTNFHLAFIINKKRKSFLSWIFWSYFNHVDFIEFRNRGVTL